MRRLMQRLKLTINEEKRHGVPSPATTVRFPELHFGRCYTETGRAYWGTRPSQKSVKRRVQSIRAQTPPTRCGQEADVL